MFTWDNLRIKPSLNYGYVIVVSYRYYYRCTMKHILVYFIVIIIRRFKEHKYQYLLWPSVIITHKHIIKSTLNHIGAVIDSCRLCVRAPEGSNQRQYCRYLFLLRLACSFKGRHVYLWTVVSAIWHYKSPTMCVGLVQSGRHHHLI